MNERTLIILKPDAIVRQLSGQILARFEQSGLKIVGMKMVWADKKIANEHYPLDEEWCKGVFDKQSKAFAAQGKKNPYKDHLELGKQIQGFLVEYLVQQPVIAAVLEGPHAIEVVRKMIGSTEPRQSAPGTIRADFATLESYAGADGKKRAVRNLVHASDSVVNANREIAIWFTPAELHTYKTIHDHYYDY